MAAPSGGGGSGGGSGAGVAGTPTGFDPRLYTKVAGVYKRKTLPPLTSLDFDLQVDGGMGSGSFSLPLKWEDIAFAGDEFLDVWLYGELLYRGFVQVPSREIESPETVTCSLHSAVALFNKYPVRWKLAYGGAGADLATIAQDLVTDFVEGTNSDRLALAAGVYTATDILLKEFDGRGKTLAQALNALVQSAPNVAIWGVEPIWSTGPPGTPQHRVYFKPRPSTTAKYYSIGGQVTGYAYPLDVGSIVNVIRLEGGPVDQPNLVYNGSFEEVAPASETVGNLLLDPSFEDNDAAWTLTGSRKFTGMDATARGSPKDGKYWLELDQNTESGIQVVLAPHTVQYTGIAWVRQETATTGRQVKLTLEGLDSGNSVVVTADTGFVVADDDWEKITVDLDPTGSATVVKVRYRIETNGGTASNDGVLVDHTALIEKGGEGAVGWRRIIGGVANASTFQWNHKPTNGAKHGGYAVRSDPSAIAGASDFVEIRTTKDKRIDVPPNERLTLILSFYVVSNPVDVSYGIIEYDSNGSNVATNESATDTINGGWETVEFWTSGATDGPGLTTNANTREVEIFIRHRDNDEVYIDAVFLCVGSRPPDILLGLAPTSDYWAGENYERRMKVEDSIFTGSFVLSAEAADSINDYGEREEDISEPLVTDLESAKRFGRDYFNVAAVPAILASLRVERVQAAAELLDCAEGKAKITNLEDAPSALFPARVHYQLMGDQIDFTADLGNEKEQFASLLRYAQNKESSRSL